MPEQTSRDRVAYRLILLLVAVAGTIFLFLVDRAYRTEVVREHDHRLSEAASTLQSQLSAKLNNLILVTTDLHAFLLTQPDPPNSHSFSTFSATLLDHYPELDALVYVGPDRIIRQIHPLAGHERAIGLDLTKRPVAPYIEKSIRERRLIVDPPHAMSDGRLAVIARHPMFRGDRFAGLAQAVLDLPEVIQNELGELGREFAIVLKDENGERFWGEERLEGPQQSREVAVGSGSWTLSVAPIAPPSVNSLVLALIWGGGGLVLLIIMRGVGNDYRLRLALKTEVAKATQELQLRNEELEQQIRQRQEVEASLRKSEQRLREAQSLAHMGNWEWDLVTGRIHWSDELYRIFGLEPQAIEPTSEEFFSRVHPEDREALQLGVAAARAARATYTPEHRIVLPDGEIRHVRGKGVFEFDTEGKLLRVTGTMQDITAQQEAEASLRKSEQRLREAQRLAHLGSWEWDLVTGRIHWSDEFYRIFGFAPQEFEPNFEAFIARIHPDDRDAIRQGIAEARASGRTYAPEHRIVLPDGEIRHVRGKGVFEFDANGKPLRIAGTIQDITEQKNAIQALEASEHKYRALLESASDGIVIANLEGQIVDVNRRIETLLGYSRNELLAMHVSQIHPLEDGDKLRTAFTSMREHGFSLFEHLLLRKDGTTTPVEVAGTLINFDGLTVALGIFRDIRERKRIEAELYQHRNHLEHLVEQRTAELVALNGELESFSYSVTHDLRAPLRAISGFTAALKEDYGPQLDGMGRDYLERITSATARMARLIDDLLRLSRMIRAELHWETVSLSKMATELLQELHSTEPERKVRFAVAHEVVAMGDPTQLYALLQNLLGNAWKFTSSRADAEIEFGTTTEAGARLYYVRDNGIGFEKCQAREIFKPFYRLHADNEYEGSGIGLATVQRIVLRHGGQVWAESEPGKGATFCFTLGAEWRGENEREDSLRIPVITEIA